MLLSAKGNTLAALIWGWDVFCAASPFSCYLHPCAFAFTLFGSLSTETISLFCKGQIKGGRYSFVEYILLSILEASFQVLEQDEFAI